MQSVQSRWVQIRDIRGAYRLLLSLSLVTIGLWNDPALAQVPVTIAQAEAATAINLLFVNPIAGNDVNGNGYQGTPFRTITRALRVAPPNTVIMLTPGTYSAESGETFPLELRSGITIQGEPSTRGQGIVIRGGGSYLSRSSAAQNVAIVGANQARLTGVTVTNPNPRGYGLWIESSSPIVVSNTFSGSSHDGISIEGSGAPIVRSNYFTQNGANGMTIFGTAQPDVRENIFERTGFGINVSDRAAPRLTRNRVARNRSGIVIQEQARPILRGNSIEANQEDGLVAIAQSQPDLGTTSDPGNNVFTGNGRNDINATAATQTIVAVGNQLSRPTAGRLDLGNGALATAQSPAGSPAMPRPLPSQSSARLAAVLPASPNRPAALGWSSAGRIPAALPLIPGAVEIPVPPPMATSPRSIVPGREINVNRGQPIAARATQGAIEIPVPPSAAARATRLPARTAPANLPSSNLQPVLLPVPSANVPLGTIGDLPTVDVSRNPLNRVRSAPTVDPARAASLGLRYRVVVEASSDSEQAQVRSIVPDAFRISSNGRVVMQVGAYSDRARADETAQMLNSNGLRASVQSI